MPDNTPYIVGAFAVTWVVFIGYAIHLFRVRRDAERRMEDAMRDAVPSRGAR